MIPIITSTFISYHLFKKGYDKIMVYAIVAVICLGFSIHDTLILTIVAFLSYLSWSLLASSCVYNLKRREAFYYSEQSWINRNYYWSDTSAIMFIVRLSACFLLSAIYLSM